jgi:hypothetical protein
VSHTKSTYALSHEGDRLFGVWNLATGREGIGYSFALGFRNSHDKSVSAGFVLGESVFVCDNLMFLGEYRTMRKHTKNILNELDGLVGDGVTRALEGMGAVRTLAERYRSCEIDNVQAHDAVCRAVRLGAIPSSKVGPVLQEWHEPRHPEFAPRNVWSLKNCFTEVWKGRGDRSMLHKLDQRSAALGTVLDELCYN